MAHDIRRITLTRREFLQALEAHSKATPHFLPKGKIVDFAILNKSSIMITVETEPYSQEATVVYPDYKLINALIRFCIDHNIIIPRDGRKMVSVANDNISLCIDLNVDTFARELMPALRDAG